MVFVLKENVKGEIYKIANRSDPVFFQGWDPDSCQLLSNGSSDLPYAQEVLTHRLSKYAMSIYIYIYIYNVHHAKTLSPQDGMQ